LVSNLKDRKTAISILDIAVFVFLKSYAKLFARSLAKTSPNSTELKENPA
jgi:hypothetical protein